MCLYFLGFLNKHGSFCNQKHYASGTLKTSGLGVPSYFKTGSGVSMVQSISRICSSWMKCCLQVWMMLFFRAHPTGPKSYRPLTPTKHESCPLSLWTNWCLQDFTYVPNVHYSQQSKPLGAKEPALHQPREGKWKSSYSVYSVLIISSRLGEK